MYNHRRGIFKIILERSKYLIGYNRKNTESNDMRYIIYSYFKIH